MKKVWNILFFAFSLCLCGGLLMGCSDDMDDNGNVNEGDKVTVRVQFDTRSGGTAIPDPERINDNESRIKSVRLYAFNGDILDNMVYKDDFNDVTGSVTVNIDVTIGDRTFYAVINEPDVPEIHSALALANHPNGIKQVQYKIANYLSNADGKIVNVLKKTDEYSLPMYGELSSVAISTTKSALSMQATRAVARIDVYMAKAEGITTVATTQNATLKVNRASQTGYIANENVVSTIRLNNNSLDSPVDATLSNYSAETNKGYTKIYSFYVPEQTCPEENDRLVFTVGGIKWNNMETTYNPFILGNNKNLVKIERNKVHQVFCRMSPSTKDISLDVLISPWNAVATQDSVIHPGKLGMTNCYIVNPGRSVNIPVMNVYKIWNWEFGKMLSPDQEVKAELIWEDTEGLITEVTPVLNPDDFSYSKIQVKTATGKSGNAVVGMWIEGDLDKTYRWSWHIWVTDRSINAVDVEGVMTMTCNLGEIISGFNVNDARIGLLYQWGRKDPLPGAQGWFMPTASTLYGKVTGVEFKEVTEDNNLINSIENPFVFYTSKTGKNDWYTLNGTQNDNLWNTIDNRKSIFDPCPEGWRVPNSRVSWDKLNSTNFSIDRENYSRIYLPAGLSYPMGGNYDSYGLLSAPGQNGHYWSSLVEDAYAMELNFNTGLVGVLPSNRAAAYNVRCIKE
ncbi:hypothetical protein POZ03_01175 [Bacteroides uniformis]|uniref:hypothetical protein n=1 Tax=Bacteroides uniformis TaxID=820 RepID=UPI00233EBED5|nr:hypothetical protein [Bacteroides uniformis]MDC1809069.1 hypothetical protein [Bacteroides uniformis]